MLLYNLYIRVLLFSPCRPGLGFCFITSSYMYVFIYSNVFRYVYFTFSVGCMSFRCLSDVFFGLQPGALPVSSDMFYHCGDFKLDLFFYIL
jgi:hypothetical protein